MRKLLLALFVGLLLGTAAPADDTVPEWAKGVTTSQILDNPERAKVLTFSDPAVWSFVKDGDEKGYLQLEYDRKKYKSTYNPKHRSPVHIALLSQLQLPDFVM